MGRHALSTRSSSSVAAVAIASLLAMVAAACAGSDELTCGDTVLVDWNNGRLGSEYAPECYRDALEDLPEDARVYTTAPEEIKRALRASLVALATRRQRATRPDHDPAAAATGRASRRLSGRQGARKPAPARAEAETTAAPAPGAVTGQTQLPMPVAITATLILVVCAGGVTSAVARRLRVRRRAPF